MTSEQLPQNISYRSMKSVLKSGMRLALDQMLDSNFSVEFIDRIESILDNASSRELYRFRNSSQIESLEIIELQYLLLQYVYPLLLNQKFIDQITNSENDGNGQKSNVNAEIEKLRNRMEELTRALIAMEDSNINNQTTTPQEPIPQDKSISIREFNETKELLSHLEIYYTQTENEFNPEVDIDQKVVEVEEPLADITHYEFPFEITDKIFVDCLSETEKLSISTLGIDNTTYTQLLKNYLQENGEFSKAAYDLYRNQKFTYLKYFLICRLVPDLEIAAILLGLSSNTANVYASKAKRELTGVDSSGPQRIYEWLDIPYSSKIKFLLTDKDLAILKAIDSLNELNLEVSINSIFHIGKVYVVTIKSRIKRMKVIFDLPDSFDLELLPNLIYRNREG